MEIMYLCVSNWNYVTFDITLPLVINDTVSLILFSFKSQLLRNLFYIINSVGLIYQ